MVPDEVWAVAAVVLGEERAHLTGWQMRDAVGAMTALGQSRDHVAWALDTSVQMIYHTCAQLGIKSNSHDMVVDHIAVDMVVSGTCLPLKGADRNEAIRQMAESRVRLDVIAKRLCEPIDRIRVQARRLGYELSSAPAPFDWDRVAKTATAAVRRLEAVGGGGYNGAATPIGRRTAMPTRERTIPSGHGTADLGQDHAA